MPARHKSARQKPARPQHPKSSSGICKEPECGRKSYARGLCQTHHRQLLTTGNLKPIRPYRKRESGTVKFAGLRLTRGCAAKVGAYATEQRIGHSAAISKILEEWVAQGAKRARRAKP